MTITTAGYSLLPVLPELILAVGAMVLLMIGAFNGPKVTGLVSALAIFLLIVINVSSPFRLCLGGIPC